MRHARGAHREGVFKVRGGFAAMMWSRLSSSRHHRHLSAVILAAGASERFHGYPKACLRVGREPAVRRIARLAREVGCSPVVVVAGPHAPEISRALDGAPVRLVTNPTWAEGRTGSLQVGIASVPDGDDLLVWPVDHPFVDVKSLAALQEAHARDDLAVWFIPMHLGHGGHPVLLRSEATRAVRELRPSEPLRLLVPWLGAQVRRVAVADPGVTENVDTPDDYARFAERWEARWTGD